MIVDEDDKVIGHLWIDVYLMQFTWLLDKKGKEIYEGDILAYDWKSYGWHHKPWIVYYDLPNQQYRLAMANCYVKTLNDVIKTMDDSKDFSSYRMEAKHRVIIGNIHENPELLDK